MSKNPPGSVPEMVCRTCYQPLNRFQFGNSSGSFEWCHPLDFSVEADHEPDPIPRADARHVVMVCDFCSGGGVRWSYPTIGEITTTTALLTHTDEEYRRRISRHWQVVSPKEGIAVDIATNRYSDRWAACDPCSDLIEARDLERLITRIRRLQQSRFGRVLSARNLLRAHLAEFWRLVRPREPIDQP
ncbi:hypothetical protein [Amycolatopsis saalfeldensis]|uniref:hypothetical protein n=1 Tax=Amycolatopsis saalfeldensis TaxID=394193 RepID=UPI0011601513|nr:hypothetical protein [Amycolatopsis saalfeldensis]